MYLICDCQALHPRAPLLHPSFHCLFLTAEEKGKETERLSESLFQSRNDWRKIWAVPERRGRHRRTPAWGRELVNRFYHLGDGASVTSFWLAFYISHGRKETPKGGEREKKGGGTRIGVSRSERCKCSPQISKGESAIDWPPPHLFALILFHSKPQKKNEITVCANLCIEPGRVTHTCMRQENCWEFDTSLNCIPSCSPAGRPCLQT